MSDRLQPFPWRALVRGVAIAYGITFMAGVVFAASGITLQTDPGLSLLLALLAESIGVAMALYVTETTRLTYLVALGLGLWLFNVSSVIAGTQSFVEWLNSIGFIATSVIFGRLLLRVRLNELEPPAQSSDSSHVHRIPQARRNP